MLHGFVLLLVELVWVKEGYDFTVCINCSN